MTNPNPNISSVLEQWLTSRLPNVSDRPDTLPRIPSLRAPETGASNETLLFDAHWLGEFDEVVEQSLVARLQPRCSSVFSEYDLYKQYRIMECLQETTLPVPQLVGYESNGELLGTPFYVMRHLPGRVISENPPYHLGGWFKEELDDSQRERIWNEAVDTIATIHRLDWQALSMEFLLRPELGDTPLQQELNEYQSYVDWIEERAGRDYPDLQKALDWLQANQPEDEPTALCWGDARAGNLLIDTGTKISAILDWEMARLGNPVHDISWWLALDYALGEGLAPLVGGAVTPVSGLPGREQVILRWEQQSGFSARDIEYYDMLCTFEFAAVMASQAYVGVEKGQYTWDMNVDYCNPSTLGFHREMAKRGLPIANPIPLSAK